MNPKILKKPKVSEALAINLTLRHYGLVVTSIKQMVSYDDQNFHIKVSPNFHNPNITEVPTEGYTLKITNTEKSAQLGHFDSMHNAMLHLKSKGLSVPIPVQNLRGNTWQMEKVPILNQGDDAFCGLHLLTFVPGQPISSVNLTENLLFQWGSLLARFHNATQDFSSEHMEQKDIFWSLQHILEVRQFMTVLEDNKMDLINAVLDTYENGIEKRLPHLPKGFIHGDFNENNILVQKREDTHQYEVKGILDFEDMHYATYAWDIGVMMAYTMLDCKTIHPLDGAGHALAGYLSLRPLNTLELSVLKTCIACRLSQSLVLGLYSYSLDPTNTYLISTSKSAWDRLYQIWNIEEKELLSKWEEIQASTLK